LGGVARDIETRVRKIPFAQGYHPEILGEYAAQQDSKRRILALSCLSLIGVFLVLYTDFKSFRLSSLVFFQLPFALVGGVFTIVLTGGVVSLGSLIGFITVLGIAARNSILLISHYRHLQLFEGEKFGINLVVRGAIERLSPILMTALTTALALLPIIIGGNRPGQEIEHPMALVILGGLITSALLNLLVVPVVYWKFGTEETIQNE